MNSLKTVKCMQWMLRFAIMIFSVAAASIVAILCFVAFCGGQPGAGIGLAVVATVFLALAHKFQLSL